MSGLDFFELLDPVGTPLAQGAVVVNLQRAAVRRLETGAPSPGWIVDDPAGTPAR